MTVTAGSQPPASGPAGAADLADLADLVAAGGVVVLSGAGISTDSGIPDYRGPHGSHRTATPMTYGEFVRDAAARRRYWARSFLGWRHLDAVRPNVSHDAVAALQRSGQVGAVLTQNVDGLHQAAGATGVVELHGSLDRVLCLGCGERSSRRDLDRRLREANAGLVLGPVLAPGRVQPDGDVDVDEATVAAFDPVGCARCGSDLLKPDVVFFGENVPRPRVHRCEELVDAARSLLVLGSSLTVMSGYRFVRRAARAGTPVAIVNLGPTRGDGEATVRVDAPLRSVLPTLAEAAGS